MAPINWALATERAIGKGHPTLADTVNRPLRDLLSQSGYDPDADPFPGLSAVVYNVNAHGGGVSKTAAENDVAIAAAIAKAVAASGGRVYFPDCGAYLTSTDVVVPASMFNSIILEGRGERDTYIYPTTNGQRGILLGAAAADASGTSTNNIGYCGIKNLSLNGSLLSAGTNIGLQITQGQRCKFEHFIIEGFDNAGDIGLYLRGSTTVGLGSAAAPHVWRCQFDGITIATTTRPCVIENGDENDFWNCNFGLNPGVVAGANSLVAIEIIQGRNNRFNGTVLSGDTGATRTAYVGLKCPTPTKGDTGYNQFYGLVAEGFSKPIWIESNLVQGTMVLGYNSSINAEDFDNVGYPAALTEPNNATIIQGAGATGSFYYVSGPLPEGHSRSFTLSAGNNTPDLTQHGNSFAFIGNGGGSSIVSFTVRDVKEFRLIRARIDANTTIVDASQSGGVNIRLWGRQNLVGATEMWIWLYYTGGTWYQLAPAVGDTTTAAFVLPVGVRMPIAFKSSDYTATPLDHTISVDASGAARVITLPAAASHRGLVLVVKKVDSSGNTVTVDGNAAETIDGAATKVLTTQWEKTMLQSDGANWMVIA